VQIKNPNPERKPVRIGTLLPALPLEVAEITDIVGGLPIDLAAAIAGELGMPFPRVVGSMA
jgi:hypothetical protein